MYIVIYNFFVIPDKTEDFFKAWKGLTELIYKSQGSLGSRLHKKDAQNYIAYAQWPSKATFENASELSLEEAKEYRNLMRASCDKIEVLHKLDVVEDLLKETQYE